MLQHWDCRAYKKTINNLMSGDGTNSNINPWSCCFRQGRSRTLCASEKEKRSCSSVTKCLNQTDDTDQTKIKAAQKGQQQSSYAGLKFSSRLQSLCLQEPLLRVPKLMSLQWQHLELPSSLLLSTKPWGAEQEGSETNPTLGTTSQWPASHMGQRVPDTQPCPGTKPGKINIYGIATMILMEGSGISS